VATKKVNEKSIENKTNSKNKGKVQVWIKKETIEYEQELHRLQVELLKFQNHVKENGLKVNKNWNDICLMYNAYQ
jgi:polyphosphate kinase 2 (PPK2 family)